MVPYTSNSLTATGINRKKIKKKKKKLLKSDQAMEIAHKDIQISKRQMDL